MIELVRLKRALAALLVVVSAVGGLAVVRQLGDAVLRSASGADPTSAFNAIPPAPAELRGAIRWLPDAHDGGRAMEPLTRTGITDAYARALAALDRAGRGDATAPLDDYFSGPALAAARDAAAATDRAPTETIHLRHDLRLDFYSDDGSIVAAAVPRADIERTVGGELATTTFVSQEEWRLVMLLEDGNWRVLQLETVRSEPVRVVTVAR